MANKDLSPKAALCSPASARILYPRTVSSPLIPKSLFPSQALFRPIDSDHFQAPQVSTSPGCSDLALQGGATEPPVPFSLSLFLALPRPCSRFCARPCPFRVLRTVTLTTSHPPFSTTPHPYSLIKALSSLPSCLLQPLLPFNITTCPTAPTSSASTTLLSITRSTFASEYLFRSFDNFR